MQLLRTSLGSTAEDDAWPENGMYACMILGLIMVDPHSCTHLCSEVICCS